MKPASHAVTLLTLVFLATIVAAAACGRRDTSRTDWASTAGRAGAAAGEKYPEPRWPSYFKPPKSVDDLMEAARSFVRNQSGLQGKGMGILQPGESVLIVASNEADPMVLDAITRALVERKITPHMKFVYDMSGEAKAQADARQKQREKGRDITKAGIYQASQWIENQFPNPKRAGPTSTKSCSRARPARSSTTRRSGSVRAVKPRAARTRTPARRPTPTTSRATPSATASGNT